MLISLDIGVAVLCSDCEVLRFFNCLIAILAQLNRGHVIRFSLKLKTTMKSESYNASKSKYFCLRNKLFYINLRLWAQTLYPVIILLIPAYHYNESASIIKDCRWNKIERKNIKDNTWYSPQHRVFVSFLRYAGGMNSRT